MLVHVEVIYFLVGLTDKTTQIIEDSLLFMELFERSEVNQVNTNCQALIRRE